MLYPELLSKQLLFRALQVFLIAETNLKYMFLFVAMQIYRVCKYM